MRLILEVITLLIFATSLLFKDVDSSQRSAKKGIVANAGMKCGDFDILSTISWWYNYHTFREAHENKPDIWCPCDEEIPTNSSRCYPSDPSKVHFVTMVWGEPGYGHQWNTNLAEQPEIKPNLPVFLGYNEPEMKDQSNIPAKDAAMLFRELQGRYPEKKAVRYVELIACKPHFWLIIIFIHL